MDYPSSSCFPQLARAQILPQLARVVSRNWRELKILPQLARVVFPQLARARSSRNWRELVSRNWRELKILPQLARVVSRNWRELKILQQLARVVFPQLARARSSRNWRELVSRNWRELVVWIYRGSQPVETRSCPTRQSALLDPEAAGGWLLEALACLVRRVLTPLFEAA